MKPWQTALLMSLAYFACIAAIAVLPAFLLLPPPFLVFALSFGTATLLDALLRRLLLRRVNRGGYTATVVMFQVGWSYSATVSLLSLFPSDYPLPATYGILAWFFLAMSVAVRIESAASTRNPERFLVLATIVLFLPAVIVAVSIEESMITALEHAAWGGVALAGGVLPLAIASHRARRRNLAQPGTAGTPTADTSTPSGSRPSA